ncbi:Bcr/CflA family multidrug efflux MFS transporter [Marinobacterium lutimaris]|uniref:Bcr/CflA family efflux transporter n=1 Tax=Marinobacterium lutimaris TaxID=568106 RepID=A0A1H6C225_9GAMM|nr:Bcr/CflA family multidrug efflux MFS transporter [Marinobacterium lutimaris]SEG66747.1 MFS transporter, DHA1 family, bicyclomycin/chloramphenicol resistance protein [Marinobacterium lutimaris]
MKVIANPHRLIVLLAALQAFGPLSIDLYLPGLPLIAEDLSSSESEIQLTISMFLVGLFIGMLFYGPLSDKYGRRRLLLGGMTLYVLASLGCALAADASQLVLFRLIQALGGAAAAVIGRTLVRDLFPVNEAARVLSLMHLVTMIATLVAPLLGGYLLILLGWRSLFITLVLFSAITLAFTAWKVPETNVGASRNASIASVFGAYFRIARHRIAIGYILCMSLTFSGMFAYITSSPFIYIGYFGLEPQLYAWLFSLNIAGVIFFVTLNARFVRHVGTQPLLFAGTICAALSGILLMVGGLFEVGGLALIVIGLLGFIGVTGVIGSNCMASLLSHYPQQAGAAAGLGISVQFGLGALTSTLASAIHDGTPMPMTLLIGCCGLGALGALMLTREKR